MAITEIDTSFKLLLTDTLALALHHRPSSGISYAMSKVILFATAIPLFIAGCSGNPPVSDATRRMCNDIVYTISSGTLIDELMRRELSGQKGSDFSVDSDPLNGQEDNAVFLPVNLLFNRSAVVSIADVSDKRADALRSFYDQQANFSVTMNLPDSSTSHGGQILWQNYRYLLDTYPCETDSRTILGCDVISTNRLQMQQFEVTNPTTNTPYFRTLLHYPEFSNAQRKNMIGQKLKQKLSEILEANYGNYSGIIQLFTDNLLVTGRISYSTSVLFIDKPWLNRPLYKKLIDNTSGISLTRYPFKVTALDYLDINIDLHVPAEALKECGFKNDLNERISVSQSQDKISLLGIWYKVPE